MNKAGDAAEELRSEIHHRIPVKIWLAFLCVVVLIPAGMVSVPPLLDYPNHLARLWLISGGAAIPPLSHIYAVNWHGIATNIGIDLAAAAFGHLISPFLLGRILLALAIILPPLGCAALSRALYKRWTPWAAAGFLLWPSVTLLAGFLNLQIGIGLAMLAAAAEFFFRQHAIPFRYVCRICIGCLLIIIHPFALMFYCLLIAGTAFGEAPLSVKTFPVRIGRSITEAWVCLIPVGLFILRAGALPGGGENTVIYLPLLARISELLSPFYSYSRITDLTFFACLAIVFFGMRFYKLSTFHPGLLLVAGLLTVLALCMPVVAFGTAWLTRRLPLMLFFTLICATTLQKDLSPNGRAGQYIKALITIGILLRTVWIGGIWIVSQPRMDSFAFAAQAIPSGSRVLPMRSSNVSAPAINLAGSSPTYRHYAALLIPWRHAFEPYLFSQPGKQPITVRPHWAKISESGGGTLLPANDLFEKNPDVSYIRGWRKDFDYIMIFDAETPHIFGARHRKPEDLQLIRNAGFVRVYKIRKASL